MPMSSKAFQTSRAYLVMGAVAALVVGSPRMANKMDLDRPLAAGVVVATAVAQRCSSSLLLTPNVSTTKDAEASRPMENRDAVMDPAPASSRALWASALWIS